MAIPWISSVARTKELTYLCRDSVKGKWSKAVADAIAQFNAAASDRVKLTRATDPKRANVEILVGTGIVKVTYEGQEFSKQVHGIRPAGFTRLLHARGGPVEKAFLLLPSTPMISTPSKTRLTGSKVMTFIALHELIHACGLEDADHTAGDVFEGNPSLRLGSGPDEDQVEVTVGRKKQAMPPFDISAATLSKISKNWSASQRKAYVLPRSLPGIGRQVA